MKTKLTVFLVSMIVLAITVLVVAQTQLEIEAELGLLEWELVDANYSWLVNYSVGYPSVDVFVRDSDDVIVSFDDVGGEDWYKVYLTNITNQTDTFDLRVSCSDEQQLVVGSDDGGDESVVGSNASLVVGSYEDSCGVFVDYVVDPTCPAGMNGSGVEGDACIITNWTQLQAMNSGLSYWYELGNDLNSSTAGYGDYQTGSGFLPISTFTGMFDGKNHTITGLFISRSGTNFVGLFGIVNNINTIIQNVGLVDVNITGGSASGGLVGSIYLASTVDNSYATGYVKGATQVGGLIGTNEKANVLNSYAVVNVNASGINSGGLVGYDVAGAKIYENCYAIGNVSGTTIIGGLIGYVISTGATSVNNSYAEVNLYGTSYMGGLIGANERANVSNSYAAGNIFASGTDVGGLIGRDVTTAKIYENCYATGNVIGGTIVGGLIGYLYTDGARIVNNSYATGDVNASGDYVGGLIGANDNAAVSNSYAVGDVVSSGTTVGGLIGLERSGETHVNCYSAGSVSGSSVLGGLIASGGTCVNSFWDNQTSGQTASTCGATGKSTVEMKSLATFTDVATIGLTTAWDFVGTPNDDVGTEDIWGISSYVNGEYPYLAYQSFSPPVVTLNSPVDGGLVASGESVSFNCSVDSVISLVNVSFVLDGVINETNSSGLQGYYIFSKSFDFGSYVWSCLACDAIGQCEFSSANRTVSVSGMNISQSFSSNPVEIGDVVYVFGHLNLTNGTNVGNNLVNVYLNGSLANGTESSDSNGDYNVSFVAPSSLGTYEVVVNSSYLGIVGSSSENLEVVDLTGPVVTLNSPVDEYNVSESESVSFNCSASDNLGVVNVSFYLNGILNETNSTGGSGNTNIDFATEGEYVQENSSYTSISGGIGKIERDTVAESTYVPPAGTYNIADTTSAPGYTILKWTSTGTTSWTSEYSTDVEVLVVAGGGAGGGYYMNGGGGAGELVYRTSFSVEAGAVPLTVGAGGVGQVNDFGLNGGNSTFGSLTALGGGGGGAPYDADGRPGGSGGGGPYSSVLPLQVGGASTAVDGVGFAGGTALVRGGGGGGGAGSVGGNGSSGGAGGAGGAGLYYFGTWLAGGGGGSANDNGAAGLGQHGGGNGGVWISGAVGTAGTPNTGGGGGGHKGGVAGHAGGSGIIIVKYQNPPIYFTTPYYLTTSDTSQKNTSSWSEISGISLTQTTPTNTSIKYLVSFDNRTSWKYWNSSAWASSSLDDLQTNGMSKTTLEGLSSANWGASGGFQAGTTETLDFAMDLSTTNSSATPEIDNIEIEYTINSVDYIFSKSLPVADYEWSCLACDSSGNCGFSSANRTVNVLGMNISESFSSNPVEGGDTVYVFGHVNLSDGTDVVNNSIGVWLNGSLTNGTESTDSNGDYNVSITAPSSFGTYPVVVNLTYGSWSASSSEDLIVSDLTGPVVTLNSPVDEVNLSTSEFDFNCTVSDNLGVVNVSLVLNGVLNGTNSSGLNGSDYVFARSLPVADYEWSCLACDSSGNCGFSLANRTVNVLGMNISESLNPNPVDFGELVYVSGKLNLTDGVNVSSNSVSVYLNGSLANGSEVTDASGNYNVSFVAPSVIGSYVVVVNSTYDSWSASNSLDLVVRDSGSPVVVLNSPVDEYNMSAGSVDFNCSASDNYEIANVSLYLNGVLNETNSSGLNASNYVFNRTLDLGSYEWSCLACDSSGDCSFSSANRSLRVLELVIGINTESEANTTNTINVNGFIREFNGTDYWNVANNLFVMKLNNVTVSSDTLNHTNFSGGVLTDIDTTSNARLNLSSISSVTSYSDDFSTTGYLTDAYSYSNEAYSSGTLFELDNYGASNIGNVTYRFASVTGFYNATAYVVTDATPSDAGGNTSVWYSLNGSSFSLIDSNVSSGATIGGVVPVDEALEFYVMIQSDVSGSFDKENPVTSLEINYTSYEYPSIGNVVSPTINLADVTYTVLKWDENLESGTDVLVQVRESDNGTDWDAWGSNYTSGLDNDITGLSKNYLQYRAWLSTTNGSVSPTLYDVQILYFNASTNSTGGYDYNITIPTTNLGVLPLSVEVVQNDATGILGSNSSDIEVWAVVELPYSESKNYSGAETNYSVAVNFTRVDNGALGVGNVDVTIWNSSFSDTKSCSSVSECEVSWGVPSEVATGNYSVNVSSNNESGYYRNATNNFSVYLEEKDTTGSVYAANKTVGDYSYGSVYHFDMNVSVTNTGEATMSDIAVYDYVAARGSAILNVSTVSACPDLLPGESGNATMSVYLKDVATSGAYLISWRANWTDNDATVSDYVSYTEMRVIIVEEATMLLSSYAETLTIQHNNSDNFSFYINSTGSDSVTSVDLTFVEGALLGEDLNLSSSWVSILTSNPIGLIPAGSASLATVQVTVPVQAAPGNYSGKLNLTAVAGGSLVLNMTLTVPLNGTWYLTPSANFSYNNSYPIGVAGEIGNYTLVNLGNVNMTFDVSYSPSGSTDYSAFGTALFEEDYNVSGVNTNPSNVSVAKGENTSITLYQKGDSSQRTDVGIIASFNNSNATPVSFAVEDAWSIEGQPPAISGVWFLLDGEYGSIAEQNKNMSIKFRATDDVALNVSGATINITWGGGATQIDATANTTFGEYTLSGADYVVLNYSGVYAPTTAGAYVVSAMVLDESGQSYSSGEYNFTSYGTTEVSLSQNYSSVNVSNVDLNNKGFVYVNYTINNSELVTAYSPTLTFAKNSSIVISNYTFGNLSAGEVASHVIQMNVSELTAAGNYNVTATLTWTNPNTGTDSDSVVFAITVEENKSFVYSPASVTMNTASGFSNSSILTINNTGNVILNSVNLSCYSGDLCSSMSVLFNESAFSIGTNSSRAVNVSLSVPSGLAAGAYSGVLNISGVGVSQTLNIYSTVPTSKTWTLSTNSINTTKGNSVSADLQEVVINNTGNVNMTWNLVSSNTSLFGLNESSLMVPFGTSKSFMINYTSPDTEGNYVGTISVTNTDGAAVPVQENITINMTVTAVDVNIVSPSSSVPLTGVEAGDLVSVVANASYGSVNITNESVWSVSIGGVSCVNASYEYNESDNEWDIFCVAPSLTDGVTYNITVVLNHTTYGEITSTNLNSVSYLDITKPNFVFTRNHVTLGNNINVQVNVSDNVGVDSVWGVLFYPNSSNVSFDLTSSGGYYINNSFALNTAGEYLVNVSANDSTGNVNYSSDWFEVYDNYAWILNLTNYAGSGVNGTNVSLYRPNTSTLLLSNTTGVDGGLTLNANERFYDMFVNFSGDSVLIRNVNFTNWTTSNISFNGYRIAGEDVDEIVTLYRPFIGIAANASGLSGNSAELSFSYDGYGYEVGTALEIIKCADWNYSGRSCGGSWAGLTSVRDTDAKRITANSSGFSVYFLAENKCGNGACETTYGETTVTCSADCTAAVDVPASSGGGGGGGGSSTSTVDLDKLLQSILDIGGFVVETTSINKEVFPGESTTVQVRLKNTLNEKATMEISVTGPASALVFFESTKIEFLPGESKDILLRIIAQRDAKIGDYPGKLNIKSGTDEGDIGINIKVLSPEGKLLDVKIQPLTPTVAPGNVLRLQVDLLNLGKTKVVDVQFDLQLIDLETGEIVTRAEEAFAVETTISVVKNLTIPDWVNPARYMVKAVAYYSNVELEGTMQASSIAYVDVQYEFFDRKVFGIYLWAYLLFFLLVALGIGGYYYLKWLDYRNKRFKTKLDVSKLPRAGKDAAFLGKVAETGIRAFGDLNKMQMHTLIAGSTGSGKTVAAQDIIEEALIHKKSVIVFDPTAQWTGFLRKCEESKMLKRYKYFDMKEKEARAFEGSIKTISDPYEIIDIKKHMGKPGEIMIFDISKLTPKEMDIVVASTIEQIFRSVPEEKSELDTLIVYDEVHRLLPKFGGSGAGFVQIERGAREFRKWGIGLVLISQVLSDFVGEIKANIGTEIQMGTRYEGDLERVSMKYGDDILKSVAKEPIGTGMNVNAEYNNGIPYFISFRPLLHSSKRLTKTELTKYAKYFDEIEDLDYQIEELKKLDVDTLDADLELKLAKSKIKLGKFQMADVYMESVRPKILEYWKQAGKEPVHMIKRRLKKDVVMTGIQKAKEERANYIKKNPQEIVSINEELLELKKEIEGKKKEGIDTSKIEIEFHVLEDRVKPFKGKVPAGDADVLRLDVERIRAELDELKVPENKKE
ncbi:MAG: Ig-like domain-containing protein [archaeon]